MSWLPAPTTHADKRTTETGKERKKEREKEGEVREEGNESAPYHDRNTYGGFRVKRLQSFQVAHIKFQTLTISIFRFTFIKILYY